MTSHLVTFASDDYTMSAFQCAKSAREHGVIGASVCFDSGLKPSDIYRENEGLFSAARGCGYWAWKPWLIHETLMDWQDMEQGHDYLIYADAGIEFINNVNYIIDRMDQDIFLFGNNWEHAHWCKADVVDEIFGKHYFWDMFGKQVQASVIFFRVSDYTRKFVKEWLDWCLFEGGRLIDDSPSRAPNHPQFQENRHDQSILTTLAYREGLRLHWWPAVYNKGGSPEFIYERGDYPDEGYPVLFSHHRKRNSEWEQAA